MEGGNYLGICLSKDTATVICLGSQGRDRNVLGCFSVSAEQTEGQDTQLLARLIAEGCDQRQLKFSEVAVALDCAMFMQHSVHSEFDDPKQIAATIRFDAEEAFSMDITDVALAFKKIPTDQPGSELTVFTAQRKILSDILGSLQSNNLDPTTIEPDVSSLSRFISQNLLLPERLHPLFGLFSQRSGYFIALAKSQQPLVMRAFLVGPTQSRTELLTREVPVTTALAAAAEPINCLKVFDSADTVNPQQLSEKLGLEADSIDLAGSVAAGADVLADCADVVDFAIAYGAALAHLEKTQTINFRNDFMPYQGKKMRLQKALKFLSVSVVALCLAVGLYFQLQLLQKNRYRSQLREKLEKDYSAVMLGKKPPPKSNPVNKLKSELRRIRDLKSGQLSITGEESITAKLTLVLEAFNNNKVAAQTNLNIDSISISAKSISIAGNTSNRRNTLKLFKAIKNKMEILQQRLDTKGGRDNFRITVALKK